MKTKISISPGEETVDAVEAGVLQEQGVFLNKNHFIELATQYDFHEPPSRDLSGWQRLTDPSQHAVTDFRYLVHAVKSKHDIGSLIRNKMILDSTSD